jgi:predicted nucleic acid-binding protein
MLVVDSGVWIDFFNGRDSQATADLADLLQAGELTLIVPDLVLFEVLRGFRFERDYRQARVLLGGLSVESTGGAAIAEQAAEHYRILRAAGFTVRSPIDVIVAAFCIERNYTLLHGDRDFVAFERLRGLRCWPPHADASPDARP